MTSLTPDPTTLTPTVLLYGLLCYLPSIIALISELLEFSFWLGLGLGRGACVLIR